MKAIAVNPLKDFTNIGVGIPIFVIILLAMMILPLPPILLDLFFTFNIALSLMVLLAGTYSLRPLDFSVFPTILLISTLLRLALNIASTRVVLLHGHSGTDAVGNVIEAFGEVVIGGNYAVGIVVFLILMIINFVVVTKGAGRISEVSARFTLDSMPGKQMAIDADLNSGLITQEEAKIRRQEVANEADFYGSMDGASKFVRGDSIAGILILFINIIGGILIGILQHGLDFEEAMRVYALLTIGDGLVAQIPSLLLSTAAAIMVTRVSSSHDVGTQVKHQVFMQAKPLAISAVVLTILGLIPGMPHMVFLGIALILGGGAYYLYEEAEKVKPDTKKSDPSLNKEEPTNSSQNAPIEDADNKEISWDDVPDVDNIALEVGFKLIPLVESDNEPKELMKRIKGVRRKLSQELGFLIPTVHIRDDLNLPPTGYRISMMGVIIAEDEVRIDNDLAISSGQVFGELEGHACKDPAFGLDAVWIPKSKKDNAQSLGYTVVDCSTVIATHLSQIIQEQAHNLFGFDEAQKLLDKCSKTLPKLVDDLVPDKLSLSVVVKVLQNLLEEQVSIRDIKSILEALSEYYQQTQDPHVLTEFVRSHLSRLIVQQVNGQSKEIPVATLDFQLEQLLQQSLANNSTDSASIDPNIMQSLQTKLMDYVNSQEALGASAILLVPSTVRKFLSKLFKASIKTLTVLAYTEIPDDKNVKIVTTLSG